MNFYMFKMILQKQNVMVLVFGVSLVSIAVATFTFLLDASFEHDSDLMRIGPSDDLLFIGLKIDSFAKYIGLITFMLFLELLDLLHEEYIVPIIHMIYAANDPSNRNDLEEYTWMDLYTVNHFSLASKGLRDILRIIVVTVQIPLAVIVWGLKEIVRYIFVSQVTSNWLIMNERSIEVDPNIYKKRTSRKM